jgi:hypothetical protein
MCIGVIATALRVIFQNENGGVFPVRGMANKVRDLANGVVVVGDLQRGRIQAGDRGAFAAEVVVG